MKSIPYSLLSLWPAIVVGVVAAMMQAPPVDYIVALIICVGGTAVAGLCLILGASDVAGDAPKNGKLIALGVALYMLGPQARWDTCTWPRDYRGRPLER